MQTPRLIVLSAGALLLSLTSASAQTAATDIPKHLAIARDLVSHIAPENNHYVLGGVSITFPGDAGSNGYSMKADCSGFVTAVLERAGDSTPGQMVREHPRPGRKRFMSEDFVYSILNGRGFRRIAKVEDLRPGDVLAHEMLNAADRAETGTTGHTMLVNSTPVPIPDRAPIVPGTHQFKVNVIDSDRATHGQDDSRGVDPFHTVQGLGTGTLRLYADDSGQLVGFATTFKRSTRFFSYSERFPSDTKLRIAAMGRPLAAN